MKPFLSRLFFNLKNKNQTGQFTAYQRGKALRELKITSLRLLKDCLFMAAGICSAAFGLEGFLLPNNFIDGGATGIALLTSEKTGFSISILLVLINIPFLILGFSTVGKQFAIKASISICLLALIVANVHFPKITDDKLLVSVFGGFFLGAGIGLSVRGGSVVDGTEVLAIYLSKKFKVTIGDVIIIFNILIFSAAAYLLSIETALYSMITYLAASKTVDFIIEGIEEYTGITIISLHSEEIRQMIINELGRGVTVYLGKKGFGKTGEINNMDIIYTVITRLEISRMHTEIEKIDPNAFVVMHSIKDTKGGMIKKRSFSH